MTSFTNPKSLQYTRLRIPLLILMLAGLFLAPPAPSFAEYEGEYPYKVTATIGMVADIVREVAGDKANVENIIGEGVDPHLYAPTRGDLAAMMNADIIFYSGLHLEGKMTDYLVRVARNRPVYAVTELIDKQYLLEVEGGLYDPHVWMDVRGWMKAVEAVRDALSEFDPPNAAGYEERAAAYLNELRKLHDYALKSFSTIPEGKRVMVTAHDAFSYMGRAYDLQVIGIQGISTESEAGLQDINNLIDLIVEKQISSIFVETSVSDKNVRALIEGAESRGHELRIGGSLYSDAMGPKGTYEGTYIGMIDHNTTTITRALGGTAPEKGMQGKLSVGSRE